MIRDGLGIVLFRPRELREGRVLFGEHRAFIVTGSGHRTQS